ncbi:hypothetical protein HMPREF0970_00530 [Schaalia odontolytica F0309]|uniref:Uncharacterized protein n=1 Tax=Schaalia odontolytica F0309 TaxID=649742 RepID=D4TX73_9ACTO|nr:hypothetical protein HMPREF0970_00530 [Schaalia odontolytica F0309]
MLYEFVIFTHLFLASVGLNAPFGARCFMTGDFAYVPYGINAAS